MLPVDQFFRGDKGIYLDIVLIETPNNKYGDDYMVVKDVPKEEREKGTRGDILGNGKNIKGSGGSGSGTSSRSSAAAKQAEDDDLPF